MTVSVSLTVILSARGVPNVSHTISLSATHFRHCDICPGGTHLCKLVLMKRLCREATRNKQKTQGM